MDAPVPAADDWARMLGGRRCRLQSGMVAAEQTEVWAWQSFGAQSFGSTARRSGSEALAFQICLDLCAVAGFMGA
jgi:hypothetical protein